MSDLRSILGVPVYLSEHIGRSEVLTGKLDGRGESVHMHPQTFYAMMLSMTWGLPMSHHEVQSAASLRWIEDRIERQAAAANARINAMHERFTRRAQARAEAFEHPHEHLMCYSLLTRTSWCMVCGYSITDEAAHDLGLKVVL